MSFLSLLHKSLKKLTALSLLIVLLIQTILYSSALPPAWPKHIIQFIHLRGRVEAIPSPYTLPMPTIVRLICLRTVLLTEA